MATEVVGGDVVRPSRGATSLRRAAISPVPAVSTRILLWRLLVQTVGSWFRYRVTSLAAEAAFFAILSLPPLVFGLAGSITYVMRRVDPNQVTYLRMQIIDLSSRVLTPNSVGQIVEPTVSKVLQGPRIDIISIGFVLALWSGSRALNVFVNTITIMYGLDGRRGVVRTRVLSFFLYAIGLVVGVVVLPLVLAGPRLVDEFLPSRIDWINGFYWPVVIVLSIAFLTTLYHLSVPVRSSWRHDAPGAALAFGIWVLGCFALRATLDASSTSIFGPLAAPIAVLLWLYITSLAVLMGAAVNASFDRIWPDSATAGARLELLRRIRRRPQDDPNRPRDIDDI